MPIRVGIDAAVDQARRRRRPAAAAATASWMSRAMYLRLFFSVLADTWAARTSSGRSRGSRPPTSLGRPATRKASSRTHGPPALGQGRPDAVRTIPEGRHQAQTGYDHAAFGTKHERLVDRRRARSQWLSRPEVLTRVEPPPYYCLRTAIVRAQTRRKAQIFPTDQDIRSMIPCGIPAGQRLARLACLIIERRPVRRGSRDRLSRSWA